MMLHAMTCAGHHSAGVHCSEKGDEWI